MALEARSSDSSLQFYQLAMGGGGPRYIADTNNVTGNFFAIMALEDTVFSALTGMSNFSSGLPLPKGSWLYSLGGFTSITLTSGKVVAYSNL